MVANLLIAFSKQMQQFINLVYDNTICECDNFKVNFVCIFLFFLIFSPDNSGKQNDVKNTILSQ